MDENNITLEEKIWAQNQFNDNFEIEEFLEDYLPEVKKHIGFKDERTDPRFIVKFHDIYFYTNTQDTKDEKADMTESEFDSLFGTFCNDMYENTKQFMEEEGISEYKLFSTYGVGHYKVFEKIIPELTEENYLDITLEIYNEGLSPDYINDYTKLSHYLQNMEDNYMTYWLEFLRVMEIPEETIEKYRKEMERVRRETQISKEIMIKIIRNKK